MKEIKWSEITKDTPIEEVKMIHQKIWDYVIEHGDKPKTPYLCCCAACEYKNTQGIKCVSCPIIWPENRFGDHVCHDINGLHTKWANAIGERKIELACQIRDIPWKFEMEEKENV